MRKVPATTYPNLLQDPHHDENSRKAPILAAVPPPDDRCNGCDHPGHIHVTRSSRTLTPRVRGKGLRPTRCRRRVLLMSTQSYPAMADRQTMTDGKERTRRANVAHGRSRSTAKRNETDHPSAGEGDFVICGYLRTLRRNQSHVLWTQW